MADGGRDAGFWVLLGITLVTAVCAAYTLLTVTGVFGNASATGRDLRKTAAGTVAEDMDPQTTQRDSATSTPTPEETLAERNGGPDEKTDAAASAGLVSAMGDSAMLGAVDAQGSRQA